MEWERFDLNPRIITAVKKANFRSAKEVLCVSGPDLQRLTRLSKTDVHRLHYAVAAAVRRSEPATALQLVRGECPVLEAGHRLSFACPVLDGLTRGGLPLRGITELAGESAAGKTQICLQLCLSVQYPQENGGLGSGAVYICTEDSFPIKRLRQLITQQPQLRADLPPALIRSLRFSDNIYIEHASDLEALQTCVSRRVPVLLKRGLVRLLVVDSVAALFRSEFQADEALQRSRHLLAFSNTLHRLSHQYGAPVVCVNQVTDVVDGPNPGRCDYGLVGSKVLPALGIAWANQVMVRLMLRRLTGRVQSDSRSSAPRKLEVVFAPHLPRASCLCGVWEEGVRGIPDGHSELQPHTSS
ncbi:DNA repair protein XRCC3 isoform X1 [Puntigrus tetrazona]|uniref:DNA repair protein XRCC3 isoform X1 n=1 Tax=Puntigrus tetrazona TaxID=1606681 RepID=UPI001C8ABC48|nr:DNA repair protein XRCC3 isoform X1 [Puntigrus tetrazona]